jgi:hypothetical protein
MAEEEDMAATVQASRNDVTDELRKTKMHSGDRKLTLRPMEGGAINVIGAVDKRLFTGENCLHAIRDPQNSLWTLRYDAGLVPAPLQQRFTSFNILFKHASEYYKKRNAELTEI